jgi:hypothetical protein
MHALSEMVALDMQWKVVHPPAGADNPIPIGSFYGSKTFGLFYGEDLVAQAQANWQLMHSFDLIMWAGEGVHQVHMDLADQKRQSETSMFGAQQSIAAFWLESEGFITAKGLIKTAGGHELRWEPTHSAGYEYVMRELDQAPLITLSATPDLPGVGGNPGHMNLGVDCAGDPELAGLVALGFALANEQVRLLHRPPTYR